MNTNRLRKEPPEKVIKRNKLIERAKNGDLEAQKTLSVAPYFLKVYTLEEREAFVKDQA